MLTTRPSLGVSGRPYGAVVSAGVRCAACARACVRCGVHVLVYYLQLYSTVHYRNRTATDGDALQLTPHIDTVNSNS